MSGHDRLVVELTARWPEHRIGPGLAREQALVDLLGHPERSCPVIQVAGTNGKGSTAIMVESLLRSAGLRVGRYSSPHLVDVTERICVDGEPISHDDFDALWEQVAPMVAMVDGQRIDGIEMTFFEVLTAMAFAAFADAPVDVAVVEVGLGGRWDATNVADAAVAVVTPVALDHTHILGPTLDLIAAEKAGIIKPGSVSVIAGQSAEAAPVLLAQCADVGVTPLLEGRDFGLLERRPGLGGQVIRVQTASGPLGELHLPVLGEHMAHNAAQAVAAAEALTGPMSGEVIAEGLASVVAPARLEVVRRDPLVVIDTFHNPHGARSAMAGMAEAFSPEPLVAVMAAMGDKDVDSVMAEMVETVDQVVVTTLDGVPRSLSVEAIAELAGHHWSTEQVHTAPDVATALRSAMDLAVAAGPQAGVLVAGSVVLAGRARELLVDPARDRHPTQPGVVVESPDLTDEEVAALEGHPLDVVDDDPDPDQSASPWGEPW